MKKIFTIIFSVILLFGCDSDDVMDYSGKCVVTFDVRGELSSKVVTVGSTIERPSDPEVDEDYTFIDWYYYKGISHWGDDDDFALWDFETMVIEDDITLYAKVYQPSTVTFNSNGGSSVASQKVKYGSTIVEPKNPTKENYTFNGWYYQYYNDDDHFDYDINDNPEAFKEWKFKVELYEDITLYAKYGAAIRSKADLTDFRDKVNSGTWDGEDVVLMADIDLSGENWTPIGSSFLHTFEGNFNGNGHTISNLTITTTSHDPKGLFGYIEGGNVSNLTLKNPVITSEEEIGAICGSLESGTISNCGVDGGSVTGEYAGGIAGYIDNSGTVDITSCYNTAAISGFYAGGIVGRIECDSYKRIDLTACYNRGEIKSDYSGGGIVGYFTGDGIQDQIRSCYNTGGVSTLDFSGSNYQGGIVGYLINAHIDACYNTALVENGSRNAGAIGYGNTIYTVDGSICEYICYQYYSEADYTNTFGTESSTLDTTMKSSDIISILNNAAKDNYWKMDSGHINDGYPILEDVSYDFMFHE